MRLTIDHEARVVVLEAGAEGTGERKGKGEREGEGEGESRLEMRVPTLLGAIHSAEQRGAFVVVTTDGGRVSFHADTPRRVSDLTWRQRHPLAGKLHWHSIRKALRRHCLLPGLEGRVEFLITHSRFSSGARSSSGAGGAVRVDGQTVLQCSPDGLPAHELGAALAEYLYLQPEQALRSANVIVASLALLDRRLPAAALEERGRAAFAHPLWTACHDLRRGAVSDAPKA